MTGPTVVVVTRWFPHALDPGYGVFVRDQASLVASDHDVAIVHIADPRHVDGNGPTLERSQLTGGLPTWRLPAPALLPGLSILSQALRLRAVGRRLGPDLVHAHVYEAAAVAALAFPEVPLVVTEHYSALFREVGSMERLRLRLAVGRAAAVTAVSETLASRLRDLLPEGRDVRVIPNALDASWFHVGGPPLSDRGPHVLGVGNLQPVKRFDRLIRAFRRMRTRVPDATLTILGDGQERSLLEAMVSDLPAGVARLPGRATREDVRHHLAQAAMVAVPSDHETFSLVTAEALAAGVPVVATRCGGPEEHLSEGTGLLVERTETALAHGLISAWERRARWDRSVLRTSVEHLQGEKVAPHWRRLYREVLEGPR